MNQILNVLTSPRFQSFYWRTAMLAVAGFVALLAESLDLFELSLNATAILGLILGEVSKALNNLVHNKPLGITK